VTAKFDGIAVGELSAMFYGGEPELVVKAAFVSKKTGQTHGWTTASRCSPAARAKLAELRALLEAELHATHFEAESADDVPSLGLGEHLEGASAHADPAPPWLR
jgi:hypothetical protein